MQLWILSILLLVAFGIDRHDANFETKVGVTDMCVECDCSRYDEDTGTYSSCKRASKAECRTYCVRCEQDGVTAMPGFWTNHNQACLDYSNRVACEQIECQNGGACDAGECACPENYSGDRCENYTPPDPCENVDCQNDGTCSEGECTCAENYSGDRCEIYTAPDPCAGVMCYNGGYCSAGACKCPREWKGSSCQTSNICWDYMWSYYVNEGHGSTYDCHSSLQTAKDRCIASHDCGAVTSQSNVGGGCYRVTHGGPTILYFNMNDEHTRNLHTYKKRYCSGEESAIGTSRQHTGPRYKGCFHMSDYMIENREVEDPRDCMEMCRQQRSKYFGVQEKMCSCSKHMSRFDFHLTKADDCYSDNRVPVGRSQSSISIYTTTDYVQYEATPRQSDLCIELCDSGEAGSLCTCDTQPPAKSLTMGPEMYEVIGLSGHFITLFAIVGAIAIVYHAASFIRNKYVNVGFTQIEGEC